MIYIKQEGYGTPAFLTTKISLGYGIRVQKDYNVQANQTSYNEDPTKPIPEAVRIELDPQITEILNYISGNRSFIQTMIDTRHRIQDMVNDYAYEKNMREQFPAVKTAYENYHLALKLCKGLEEKNDENK